MKKLLTIFFLAIAFNSFSQEFMKYSSLLIPDSLKKDADAVYLLDEEDITVHSASKMTIRQHSIITVLNKKGMAHSSFHIGVDKLVKLDEATVVIYDQLGMEIKRYKKKDFALEGMYSSNVLASDSKVYTLSVPVPDIPFTVEFDYTTIQSGVIDLPEWFFSNENESILKSKLTVKTAAGVDIKYKNYNIDISPTIKKDENFITYVWEVSNRCPLKSEPHSLSLYNAIPRLDISLMNFEYDGYPGTMTSWKEFGKWRYPFYTEAEPFSPDKVSYIKSLIKNAVTEREKVSILYKYLQHETRYVYIGYGIGGFKPFPASFVESKKYGDCKALSNYMKQLLQAAGIKSYTASIYAGKNYRPFDPDFVSNKSNHVILCIPLSNDTMWLECTGKQTIAGVLGSFTENRNALLITENGGILVNTPASKSVNNRWVSTAAAELYEDGGAVIKSRVFVTGEFWEYLYYYSDGKTKDEIKQMLVNGFGYKAPDEFEFKILNDSADGHTIEISLAYYKYFDFKAGSKHFFPLRQYKLNDETIKPAEARKYDFLFDFPYIKTDSITYKLPSNFKKESVPTGKEIKNSFVQYSNHVTLQEANATVTVATSLELTKHIIPPKQFNEVADIFEAIKKDEAQKLILKQE